MLKLNIKIRKTILLQIIVILLFLIELLLFSINGYNINQITVLQYELIIVYFSIYICAYIKLGPFNLYSIFLFTMLVFIYARIFLDALGLCEWEWANKWNDFYFPVETQFQILSLLILSLLCVNLGHSMTSVNTHKLNFSFPSSSKIEQWAIFFFILAIPGITVKYLLELKVILSNGYLAIFDGTLANLSYPLWTMGAGTIFISSYAIFLASRPAKKKFIIISSIFFILNILNMLKGSRNKMMVPFLFLLWYYYNFYKSKPTVPFYKIAFMALICIAFSQWMVVSRIDSNEIDYSTIVSLFFVEQGVSILILGYMVYYKNLFINNSIPYILGPLFLTGTTAGQTFESLQQTYMLSYKLTYFLSPSAYYAGEGIGSSYLGEFYDLGIIGFIVMSFILGYFIKSMDIYVKRSRIMLVLAYFIVQEVIYMPRNTFFPLLIEILPCIFIYFVIKTLSHRTNFRVAFFK